MGIFDFGPKKKKAVKKKKKVVKKSLGKKVATEATSAIARRKQKMQELGLI